MRYRVGGKAIRYVDEGIQSAGNLLLNSGDGFRCKGAPLVRPGEKFIPIPAGGLVNRQAQLL